VFKPAGRAGAGRVSWDVLGGPSRRAPRPPRPGAPDGPSTGDFRTCRSGGFEQRTPPCCRFFRRRTVRTPKNGASLNESVPITLHGPAAGVPLRLPHRSGRGARPAAGRAAGLSRRRGNHVTSAARPTMPGN